MESNERYKLKNKTDPKTLKHATDWCISKEGKGQEETK